jgi:hypothetical protein
LAQPVSARLSNSELRKFGVVVGTAFLLLGALVRWRGFENPALVFWLLGGSLFLLGLILPAVLRPVYRAWMGMALLISRITTPIIMAVLYFVVLTPVGWIARAMGHRPLVHEGRAGGSWITRDPGKRRSDMERQF